MLKFSEMPYERPDLDEAVVKEALSKAERFAFWKLNRLLQEVMIEDEINQMKNDYLQRLINQGVSADAVKKYLESADATLNENFRPDAEARVKTTLLVQAVAAKEGIEASEEDLEKEYETYADLYKTDLEKVKESLKGSENYLKEDIVYRKTVDFIYDNAKIVEPKEKKAKE